MIEFVAATHQVRNNPNQVTADSAANATIVHLKDFFISIDHQFMIDANFTKFIDNYGDFFAMLMGENAIEQGSFACAEVACEDGDGDGI
jgi:hypothetical protein